jgi:Putative DNA-binding domain
MPTLLEIERAVRASLLDPDDQHAARHIIGDALAPEARLGIYRNTFHSTLTKALRLNYPAVDKLVGAEFFEGAARFFIDANPPKTACLDNYGEVFPDFLSNFGPAASLAYLPDVARLEWAVSRALHAPDVGSLDMTQLSAVPPEEHGAIRFTPHPSVGFVAADCPADAIWRAVLAGDDEAMAAIDPGEGPIWLLVRRQETGIDVARLAEREWRFLTGMCAGQSLEALLETSSEIDASAILARALADGLFIAAASNQTEQARTEEAIP